MPTPLPAAGPAGDVAVLNLLTLLGVFTLVYLWCLFIIGGTVVVIDRWMNRA